MFLNFSFFVINSYKETFEKLLFSSHPYEILVPPTFLFMYIGTLYRKTKAFIFGYLGPIFHPFGDGIPTLSLRRYVPSSLMWYGYGLFKYKYIKSACLLDISHIII